MWFFRQKKGLLECKPEWNREAITFFFRLTSLRRLQATPPLQISLISMQLEEKYRKVELLSQFRILGAPCISKTFSNQISNRKHFWGKHLLKTEFFKFVNCRQNYVRLNIYINFIFNRMNPKEGEKELYCNQKFFSISSKKLTKSSLQKAP